MTFGKIWAAMFLCVALCFAAEFAVADTDVRLLLSALDVGRSNDGADFLRLGRRHPFQRILYDNGVSTISGYYELSLNHWSGYGDSAVGVALSPVFVASFCDFCTYVPYVEAGVGVAMISRTEINGRDMSSLFQFEDRIGIGVRMSTFDIHFRYMHYSNAGTVTPNEGMDIFVLGFMYMR